ncbi:MAG TPA: O-antigen ligase family protein [Gemmatimonadota bacterium]|nr:O-antigen ligase family protein [Gemmatimonadota bacterium]
MAILRRPVLGLVALVLMVYLDLSDILIRFHGLPSLLQLLAIPLLLAALVRWRGRVLEGASPAALTVALLAYVAVFVASLAVAAEPALAQGRAVAAAKGFAICVLVALLADTPEKVRIGAWTLAGGGLLLAGIALAHAAVGAHGSDFGGFARVEYVPVYEDVMEVRAAGPLGDANFFAQILVAVVPIALLLAWKERNRWLQILALAAATVISVATLFTYSRGGALALAVVVVCSLFAAHPSRRRLAVGGLLIVAALVLVPRNVTRRLSTLGQLLPGRERVSEIDTSFQSRLLQARVAWEIFIDHPLLGVGAGNYTAHYYEYADEVGSAAPEYDNAGGDHYPHDLYLELASETGFLGLAAFGAVLVLVFGYLRRAERSFFAEDQELHAALASALQIAVLGYLVSSLFLHGHFQRYLWILLGLSLALAREAPGEPRTAAFSVDGVSPGDAAGSLAGGRTAEPRATRAALAAGAASFAREGKEMT